MRITRNRFGKRFTSKVILDSDVSSVGYHPQTETFSFTTTDTQTGDSYEIRLTGLEMAHLADYRNRIIKEYSE